MKSLWKKRTRMVELVASLDGIIRKGIFDDITDKFPHNFPFKSHKKKITRAISFTPAVVPFSFFIVNRKHERMKSDLFKSSCFSPHASIKLTTTTTTTMASCLYDLSSFNGFLSTGSRKTLLFLLRRGLKNQKKNLFAFLATVAARQREKKNGIFVRLQLCNICKHLSWKVFF